MRNFNTPLINWTKEYVAGFIAENFTEKICYHNIDHTLEVVESSEIIGKHCNISKEDMEIVIIAAWFHDTGYYLGCDNHEEASANIAKQYLVDENFDPEKIKKVANCILSTKIPQAPQNILERIICDADLFHLGSEKFFDKSELLWRELTLHNQEMTYENWLSLSKEFVEAHKYHTSFGKEILLPIMGKNLAHLKLKIKEYEI